MPEERMTSECECNQGRELVCIQLLLNMAREFYACEQNTPTTAPPPTLVFLAGFYRRAVSS